MVFAAHSSPLSFSLEWGFSFQIPPQGGWESWIEFLSVLKENTTPRRRKKKIRWGVVFL